MSTKHRNRSTLFVTGMAVLAVGLLVAGRGIAGSLDPTNAPGPTMRTMEEIYQKLAGGAAPSTGSLDPTNAPAPTMHTLQAIYDAIVPTNLSASSTAVAAGLYAATTLTAVDADLVAGNIATNVTIFGVNGTVVEATGDAVVGEVLTGKTFSKAGSTGLTGTMTNQGALGFMPGAANIPIPSGFYSGSGMVTGDANLAAGNIATNVTIFGIAGTANTNGGGSSVTAAVPKTGQTTSYADYDDGWNSTNIGVAWPNPRFEAVAGSGSETNQIRDNLTGLIWARNANLADSASFNPDWSSVSGTCTWYQAFDVITNSAGPVNGATYGGTNDWRLPNHRELFSLTDARYSSPALCNTAGTGKWISGDPFAGVQSDGYWSSTTYAVDTAQAWSVNLNHGYVGNVIKSYTLFVWPVRGGP